MTQLEATWLGYMPPMIRQGWSRMPAAQRVRVEEVRIRAGRPVELTMAIGVQWLLGEAGEPYVATREDCAHIVEHITEHSRYRYTTQLQQGYITIPGGHRIGFVGRVALDEHKIKHIHEVASLNIRIAREQKGCATPLLPYLYDARAGTIHHTLIIAPPQRGKTTLLRDLARQLSDGTGTESSAQRSCKVGIVDERSELAACVAGVPTFDVGLRTDVLDNCPKATGMMMFIRAMSPDVIVVDEIGREEDGVAIHEAVHAGIRLVTSAHGHDLQDVQERSMMQAVIQANVFQRYVQLGPVYAKGRMCKVYDGQGRAIQQLMLPYACD